MKKPIQIFAILALFILFSSCKELDGGYTGADKGVEVQLIGGLDAVEVDDETNDGHDDDHDHDDDHGALIFSGTAANGGNSGHNFKLKFHLPEGEEVKFFFFTSREYTHGVEVKFSKVSGKVLFQMELNGTSDSRELTAFYEQDLIEVELDVHNDHGDTHVLMWHQNGPFAANEDCTFENTCLYNTGSFEFDIWAGSGKAQGTFWGFLGKKSLIKKVEGPLAQRTDV